MADLNLESLIRLNEREHVARELHDSTAQLLVALELELNRFTELAAGDHPDTFGGMLRELRLILFELHQGVRAIGSPSLSSSRELLGALESMARDLAQRTGLKIRTDLSELPIGVPVEVGRALYRVAQESVANALRHGKSTDVMVRLSCSPESITLEIADDGVGFSIPRSNAGSGRGIANMKARMNEVGGTLSVSNRDNGALVQAKVARA